MKHSPELFKPKIKSLLKNRGLNNTKPLLFILFFALIGTIALFVTRAAAPNASIEPEQGNPSRTDLVVNDSTASGGKAVRFNADTITTAPATQGTWTSPEGAVIEVNSAGTNPATGKLWTIADIYKLLLENSAAAGDLNKIAPSLTIRVQDVYMSSANTSAVGSSSEYTSVQTLMWLKGSANTTFSLIPDAVFAHEYGHAWTMYHHYLSEGGDWNPYLRARGLAGDPRIESSYSWSRGEIIADDYRLLFGSAASLTQRPNHLNSDISEPADVPGLRDFMLGPFRTP